MRRRRLAPHQLAPPRRRARAIPAPASPAAPAIALRFAPAPALTRRRAAVPPRTALTGEGHRSTERYARHIISMFRCTGVLAQEADLPLAPLLRSPFEGNDTPPRTIRACVMRAQGLRASRRAPLTPDSWPSDLPPPPPPPNSSRVVRGLSKPLFYMVAVSSFVCAYETARAVGARALSAAPPSAPRRLPAAPLDAPAPCQSRPAPRPPCAARSARPPRPTPAPCRLPPVPPPPQAGVIPLWAPSLQLNSKEVFGLTSFALSLLLVFRTNARWARGRGLAPGAGFEEAGGGSCRTGGPRLGPKAPPGRGPCRRPGRNLAPSAAPAAPAAAPLPSPPPPPPPPAQSLAPSRPAARPARPRSYERWDGARKMWGLVLNRSRDFVRQGLSYFPADRPELKEMLVRWTPAFSKSLMCHLRKDDDYTDVLKVGGGGGRGRGRGVGLQGRWPAGGAAARGCWRGRGLLHAGERRCHGPAACVAPPPLPDAPRPPVCPLPLPPPHPPSLQDILLPHELDSLMMATHRPNYALQVGWGPAGGERGLGWEAGAAAGGVCLTPPERCS
jgi:hypothetical protein